MLANLLSARNINKNQPPRSLRTQRVKSTAAAELRELLTKPGEISHWLVGGYVDSMGLWLFTLF
jgi:hypothetical protein